MSADSLPSVSEHYQAHYLLWLWYWTAVNNKWYFVVDQVLTSLRRILGTYTSCNQLQTDPTKNSNSISSTHWCRADFRIQSIYNYYAFVLSWTSKFSGLVPKRIPNSQEARTRVWSSGRATNNSQWSLWPWKWRQRRKKQVVIIKTVESWSMVWINESLT